ncbi:DUF5696 domain-containing protein [Acholeplasma laidlawii]|uniref:DUF5696 domain-containing protein n=1 Tax=Acholeplasma laidlawii TaxID=2148 RepID=UPI000C1A0471|nr:DUF5696 domain-containing protein [Acholeplasma laidlawii]PII02151.1 hypothetical protein B9P95_000300 [Acholeplasma laidlawii]
MFSIKRTILVICIVILLGFTVNAVYIESSKDTKMPPDEVVIVPLNKDGFTLIQENANFEYYYKKHNGIFAVYDKRNGFTWKSGIDHDYDGYIESTVELFIKNNPGASDEDILAIAKPLEEQMNNSREGIANSLIMIEYLNRLSPNRPLTQTGSSTKNFIIAPDLNNPEIETVQERVSNSVNTDVLKNVNNDPNHFRLDFKFKAIDVEVKVHLHLTLDGFSIEIRDSEIEGDDTDLIGSISIAPFMGSYGGKISLPSVHTETFESEEGTITEKEVKWDTVVNKPRNEGYIFVPDGSGALIRFTDYQSSLNGYTGHVYGQDIAQLPSHSRTEPNFIPHKDPSMPVFGISYGDGTQAAFLSHTSSGDEYMQIYSRPSNSSDAYNLTDYMIAHSRYLYNRVYTQVYNQSGASYQSLFEERNHFDIHQHFYMLAGDGTTLDNPYRADYVGMAIKYRDYLHESGVLSYKNEQFINIPMRIDFLMSDAKNALIGTEDVVVTTIDEVKKILETLQNEGVYNINSGLLGYQKGGVTLGRKSSPNWSDSIGSKSKFTQTVKYLNELGIDVSLHQDYTTIYSENMFLIDNAMKHIGGWYSEYNYRRTTGPVEKQYYATPNRASSWVLNTYNKTSKIGFESYTYDGISNLLYSHYRSNENITTVTDTIKLYEDTFTKIDASTKINDIMPNMYLWPYVDRHLSTPLFSSQHLVETDTVPFLQLVLNGAMENYATYSNFSFYQQKDVLRMIDYNTFPSFVLTHDPAYKLIATHSSNYYSTEFTLYEEMIKDIYNDVNSALASVMNEVWVGRSVLQPGVIVNTYANGYEVVINYTEDTVIYKGITVEKLNYKLVI